MARPFPNTFEKDSPMTPQSATSNISYQTNVSRQKTKKWAEAKKVDYGGDDWGDDDGYDYDPPPPPPAASKPTGLRQQGQAAASGNVGSMSGESGKRYGDLPPVPGPSGHNRTHSFDADDEKRNFSSSTVRQPSPPRGNAPATRFSQITGVSTLRNSSGPPVLSISTLQPAQDVPQQNPVMPEVEPFPQTQALPGETPSITSPSSDLVTPSTASDYHARRDYSPSAVVPPLTTRGPQSAVESTSTRFPARKSSLSQSTGPPLEEIMHGSVELPASKSWTGSTARESSPGASSRSLVSSPGKALPFIRPADIYKRRMEEEREKERQSLESTRPSMDSMTDPRQIEGSTIHQLRHKTSSESLGAKRRMSNDAEDVDSGRRLMPMLDTVTERKSEYGFDGVDITKAIPQATTDITKEPIQSDNDKTETGLRLSSSPKLPDLNRISGFGMDMFIQPSRSSTSDTEAISTNVPSTHSSSANDPDSSLKSQPSIGFRSVVNQAFDTPVPQTPASSGVKRTDSESTGTTGISPIISRAPSSAVAGSRQPEMSILEVVNEPNSPESSHAVTVEKIGEDIPGFKLGHRRNISAPSPGNSPARTPDLGMSPPALTSHVAEVDVASPDEPSAVQADSIHAPRPDAGREASFRPSLPGAWTSYATTTEAPSRSISRKQTPIQASQDLQEEDLTPTTTKQSLPESALEATLVSATMPGAAGATMGKHDPSEPMPPPAFEDTKYVTAPESLKSVYSAAALDPRVFPPLEKAPPETQLRPDIVNRSISNDSNAAPTPPPKDTPKMESLPSKAGYFPTLVAPVGNVSTQEEDDDESDGEWDSPTREALPVLNTGTPPSDDENERLREEIVKSLSPRPSDATRKEETLIPEPLKDNTYVTTAGRESAYLPSELYDNYLSSADEGQTPPAVITESSHVPGLQHAESVMEPIFENKSIPAEVAPLSPQRLQPSLEPPRPALQNRFSWEKSSENLPLGGQPSNTHEDIVSELPGPDVTLPIELDVSTSIPNPVPSKIEGDVRARDPETEELGGESTHGKAVGMNGAIVGGSAAIAAAAAYAHHQPARRLSLAEEKDPTVTSTTYPVSPTPPEDEHPARSSQPYMPPLSTVSLAQTAPSTVSPVDTPTQQNFPPATKLIAFKEIMAISAPEQRIQTFNTTRQYWASIDPGLNDWMVRLQGQYPEHADATGSWGGPNAGTGSGSTRMKFPKVTSSAPPLQQPYYQQYLNASSPTTTSPSTPTAAGPSPGQSFQPTAPQQGFNASGSSKLTTQQVQAKGKEFLHTAGIFGGKAGKAGKGLLAKGKNKFRGSGGGDKSPQTSPPPPSKPKTERRSSWGFPLGLNRSSNRNDSSSRLSKDSTPPPTFQRSRAATTTSWDSSPAQGMSSQPVGQSQLDGTMSGALPFEHQQTHSHSQPQSQQQYQPPMTPNTIRGVTEGPLPLSQSIMKPVPDHDTVSEITEDEEDALPVPAPIGKAQPSWDPFNAAPISEEGSQVDESIKPGPAPTEIHLTRPSLAVPAEAAARSERSNSDETRFYDAAEEPAESSDWVMVSADHDSKETLSKEEPVLLSKDENLNGLEAPQTVTTSEPENPSGDQHTPELEIPKPLASPTTSIINRPRGSSYDYPLPVASPSASRFSANSPTPAQTTATSTRISSNIPPPVFKLSQLATVPVTTEPSPQELERQNAASSFLPPIRRTSTFGIGFGSRHPKPRFPLDEGDEVISAPEAQIQPQQINRETPAPDPVVSPIEPKPSQAHDQVLSNAPDVVPIQNLPPNGPASEKRGTDPQSPPKAQSQQRTQQGPMWTTRPPLPPDGASNRNQQVAPIQAQRMPISPPRGADILQQPEFRESHVEWRPNRPKAGPAAATTSPSYLKEMGLPPPRNNSWEPGAEQEITRHAPAPVSDPEYDEKPAWPQAPPQQRPYEQPPSSAQRYPELFRPGQVGGPEAPRGSVDLPAHYYQAPLSRTAAFLPRQQTNEYQLPGVGPPEPPAAGTSRRNSGFFKEIGGKLSRASSRERRSASISRRERRSNSISRDQPLSRGNEYADSIAPSEAAQERQKKRSSFFGGLHNSGSGINTPASRESVIAHHASSRVDLTATPPAPLSPKVREEKKKSLFAGTHLTAPKPKTGKTGRASTASTTTAESATKKNRFSGLSSIFGKSNSSTKTLTQAQPQATRELSYDERQPIESPLLNATRPKESKPLTPNIDTRSTSQQRSSFGTMGHGAATPASPGKDNKPRRPSASGLLNGFMGRKANTDRGSDDSRSQGSVSNRTVQPVLLAQTYSDLNDELPVSSSQGRQGQNSVEQRIPDQRTRERVADQRGQQTSDQRMRDLSHQRRPDQSQNFAVQSPERGRQPSKEQRPQYIEPQYDSVPIPGGYSLVRGQGAMSVHTDYDPKGLNRMQYAHPNMSQDPRYNNLPQQPRSQGEQRQHQDTISKQRMPSQQLQPGFQEIPPPSLSQHRGQPRKLELINISTLQNYQAQNVGNPRLSREDLLARSPPKILDGQQRPYEISLPGGDDDDEDERPVPLRKDPINSHQSHPAVKAGRPGAVLRLQQPTLRHPESPAGYPLPEDTVFSPVNPGVNDIPPPPPPKWPSHLDQHQHQDYQQNRNTRGHDRQMSLTPSMSTMNLDMDLDRSNTRRTAVSAISAFSQHDSAASPTQPAPQSSMHHHHNGALSVPIADGHGHIISEGTSGRPRGSSISEHSPTPPNLMRNASGGTPGSNSGVGASVLKDEIRRTEVNVPIRPPSQDDLYNASPRLPNPRLDTSVGTNSNGSPPMTQNTPAPFIRSNANSGEGVRDASLKGKQPQVQEEKIHYAGGQGQGVGGLYPGGDSESELAAMSATSYPGQEWNPYAEGVWDDGD